MNCEQALRQISAYVDRELPPDQAAHVTEHLAVCPACRHEEQVLRALDAGLRSLPAPVLPALSMAQVLTPRPRPGVGDRMEAFFSLVLGLGRWPRSGREPWMAELGDAPPLLLGSSFLRLIGQGGGGR